MKIFVKIITYIELWLKRWADIKLKSGLLIEESTCQNENCYLWEIRNVIGMAVI